MKKKSELRRGFISDCKWYSRHYRKELCLNYSDPLCPWRLCQHLHIPVFKLSDLPNQDGFTYLRSAKGAEDFSAVACYHGVSAFIVVNDLQSEKRLISNLAHELGHIILGHPPAPPFKDDGKRRFKEKHEAEAERFGPEILVSDEAAMSAYQLIEIDKTETYLSLSDKWQITKDVIRMRINLSGAKKRLLRAS